MINEQNWDQSMYSSQQLNAFISLLAAPNENAPDQVRMEYGVTLSDKEFKELNQKIFPSLPMAIDDLNNRYSHWKEEVRGASGSGGCGSCEA